LVTPALFFGSFLLDSGLGICHNQFMQEKALVIQGRQLGDRDVAGLRELIATHPEWSRRHISQQLCAQWNWRNGAGQYKDMAARTLLVKLQKRGLISLPRRRQRPTNRMRAVVMVPRLWDQSPIQGPLAERSGLRIEEVSQDRAGREELAAALEQFHYLGSGGGAVGENLQYRVRQGDDRLLAGLWFGSAAWKCGDRDHFIGWTAAQREANLWRLTNNCRFLILPWVQVAHLGSWILGQVLRRLSGDWQKKYGHGITLVETFVERDRFRGTVYRAANWQGVGQTQGRSRQDRYHGVQVPVKDIYVYPLHANFRQVLDGTA
jgi:hypothetical protein